MAHAIRLATEQVARFAFIGEDTSLELRIEDGGGGPAMAGGAMDTLLEAGVAAVVGPVDGRALLAALPRAAAAGVPVLVPGAAPVGGLSGADGVFRVASSEAAVARAALGAVAADLPEGPTALIGLGDDPQTRAAKEALRSAAAQLGHPVDTEVDSADASDLSDALDALEADPPSLLLLADAPEEHDLLLEALRGVDLGSTILVGGDAFNTARGAPGDAEGVVSADLWFRDAPRAESEYFLEDWRAAFDDEPGSDAARAYTAVVLVAHALRLACSGLPADVHAGLSAIQSAPTPLGSWRFDAAGESSQPPAAVVWRSGGRSAYAATGKPVATEASP